ncbi:anhydro-N-acetylmuramic acid kinase [Paracoccus sp. P2]|uniref:Anhydro-N-acetylmuramic acid kinase n=1 Tax=Paracoccus pantotrophus TaxID=82367 RepID=A0A7H9BRJ3_PARPN|nr:anhydro-N-acetylmuramic acid kinase [Paracoccus pantotrophus]MDF3852957.1 anhydro-N-acetylmuramic acid kinase [Paracoccus pantotrophus]QLH13954.1 anhydro-N-acetylmuramic acid kinase [Paracoccus pantotrophus]RDE00961.1 anhydro-N-acetylmuramic acid kinase [Paracoccus pantotrophus]RNI17426.1 anhydro-N-acetylmuramic acid kinase [Paracoccus pantotrophus]WGR66913.1 anhydro-N-acetylmuramic acid kinase [Paracoccus pantotrophus]
MIHALGMMSGTSLDGVDAAMIETDGRRIAGFGRSAWRAYSGNESGLLHAALGQWPGGPDVADAAALSVAAHAALAEGFPEAELVGYHGQTLAHDPAGRGTHQAGDGAALARRLDRPVVWDFRSEDVRQGGEGAPLAPFFHWACAEWAMGQGHLPRAPVAFLNLGGVGNLTFVDPAADAPEAPGACIAFDTGPANAPLNDLMRARRGLARDEGGRLALQGNPDERVIARFLEHPHFARPLPKSLDRDAFPALAAEVAGLSDADAAATLTHAAAAAVAAGMAALDPVPGLVLVCGGGRHNAALMAALAARLAARVAPVEEAGLDGDMLEAQAFGWLAVRVLRGLPTSGPGTTGAPGPVCGGRISHPPRR